MGVLVESVGLLVGVWALLGLIDVVDGWTSRLTPDHARERIRRWLEQHRREESTPASPRARHVVSAGCRTFADRP